jgi:hypothetical protein
MIRRILPPAELDAEGCLRECRELVRKYYRRHLETTGSVHKKGESWYAHIRTNRRSKTADHNQQMEFSISYFLLSQSHPAHAGKVRPAILIHRRARQITSR